jgi:hypothetical protein
MAEKTRLFDDRTIYSEILAANHPRQAQKLGQKIQNFQRVFEKFSLTLFDTSDTGYLPREIGVWAICKMAQVAFINSSDPFQTAS